MKGYLNSLDQISHLNDSLSVKPINLLSDKLKKNMNLENEKNLKKKHNEKVNFIQKSIYSYKQKDVQQYINPSLEKFILKPDNQNKEVCGVCLSNMEYANDLILQCSICLEFVHQSCYGSKLFEIVIHNQIMKEWKCNRCEVILKKNFKEEEFNSFFNKVSCLFCPMYTGLTKKITDFFWAHICCVNWIPEVYFEDSHCESVNLREIKWVERKCYICKLTVGHSIKCEHEACNKYFHVTCGMSVGSIYDCNLMRRQICISGGSDYKKVYCANHTLEYMEKNNILSFKLEDSKCMIENKISIDTKKSFLDNNSNKKFTERKRMSIKKIDKIENANIMIPRFPSSEAEEEVKKKNSELIKVKNDIYKKMEEIIPKTASYVDLIEEEFELNEKKFYTFMEKDIKRIKDKRDSLLTISSFNKLTNFIKKYVELSNFQ